MTPRGAQGGVPDGRWPTEDPTWPVDDPWGRTHPCEPDVAPGMFPWSDVHALEKDGWEGRAPAGERSLPQILGTSASASLTRSAGYS